MQKFKRLGIITTCVFLPQFLFWIYAYIDEYNSIYCPGHVFQSPHCTELLTTFPIMVLISLLFSLVIGLLGEGIYQLYNRLRTKK